MSERCYCAELVIEDDQPIVLEVSGDSVPDMSIAEQIVIGGGNLQPQKYTSVTPTEAQGLKQVLPDDGYDGMEKVYVTVGAISPTYVGSMVPRKDSTDLTASGATVTAPAGYYANNASKTIDNAVVSAVGATVNADTGEMSGTVTVGTGGYIAAGSYPWADDTPMSVLQGQTVTPSSSQQTFGGRGYVMSGALVVSGLPAANGEDF